MTPAEESPAETEALNYYMLSPRSCDTGKPHSGNGSGLHRDTASHSAYLRGKPYFYRNEDMKIITIRTGEIYFIEAV